MAVIALRHAGPADILLSIVLKLYSLFRENNCFWVNDLIVSGKKVIVPFASDVQGIDWL